MRNLLGVGILIAVSLIAAGLVVAVDGPPPWAYGFATPPPPAGSVPAADAGRGGGGAGRGAAGGAGRGAAAEDPTLQHLPGSTLAFTSAQIRNPFGPADWFPGDHPAMPDIVAHGRAPEVNACSLCHYPNGKGRPENSAVTGLPYAYFVQTMMDFKNGNRKTADPRKANTGRMAGFAKAMTQAEIEAAAAYFSSMKWTPWIRVVETNTVPKTRIQNGMFLKLEGNATEPIGQRIIEAAENAENTEQLRDPHSGFVAYVPVGSIKRGEDLVVRGGAGKTTACGVCHGANLEGLGPVPPLAGRSPSYLVRQLYDMQQGFRTGTWTELMKPVVAKLSADDMLAIAAYTASRPVGPAAAQQTRAGQ
jgi:cytochrome c553